MRVFSCKFIVTNKSIYIRRELNIHRIGLVHQHSRGFIVLEHYNGCCEIMRKRPISFTIPNITCESILPPVVSIREEKIFYTITFTECQKKKNGCQKFTNWYSLTDCKKKTLISTWRSVLVDVFLNNIPDCYKCADNFEIAKTLWVLKMNSRHKYIFFMALIANKSFQGVFLSEKRGYLLLAVE